MAHEHNHENNHDHHHEHNHEHEHEHIHCSCCSCDHDHEHEHEEELSLPKLIIAGVLFILSLLLEHIKLDFAYQNYALLAVTFAAYILVGRDVVKDALLNLLHGKIFDEKFLMSLASLSAVCIGELPEAVAIMLFYQIGEKFEDYAGEKSEKSIARLMEIRPDSATLLKNGIEYHVKAEELSPGDIILVKPGERIPADGIVTKGISFTDNSAITGECVPVEIFEGTEVYSGAINKNAPVEIKVTHKAEESAAARIIELVEFSNSKKTKTERFITKFSRFYTPVVCILAFACAILPPVFIKFTSGQWLWKEWIYRAISFLVVSCPCAIIISVPLAFFGAIGCAGRKGILIKGSTVLETLSKVKTAVFDKTGTLTKGVFAVTEICPADSSISPEELLKTAAHAELKSIHPVAKSLGNAHFCAECKTVLLTETEEISGHGIKTILNGNLILAGNAKLMQINGITNPAVESASSKAGTVIHIARDGKYLGHIVISDEVKNDAKNAVTALKKLGVSKIVMLTGDNEKSAAKTASELGITEVYPELLPEDKVSKLEILLEEQKGSRGKVIFAGDGINDAPVLARSDAGIAMGALGTDAAIESADVVIMTDEPSKIVHAIKISSKALSIVYQNIVFSLGIKGLIMILAALGISNLWIAVFGDVGVAFLAILNSMRTLNLKARN